MLHALPVSADGLFTLTDRTETRARAPDPVTNELALDVDTLLDARAVWTARDATYTLANRPRFSLIDFNSGSAAEVGLLDSGQLAGEWRLPHVQLRASEDASYGYLSTASSSVLPPPGTPTATATPNGQPAPLPSAPIVPPTSKPLLYGSSQTSVGTTLELRRWTVSSRVGYQIAGGADASSQQSIPLQHGPLAQAIADYRAGHRDHLATVASGAEATFSAVPNPNGTGGTVSGTEDLLVSIEEQWRHQWARRTDTMLSGGWYAARMREAADAAYKFPSAPIAEAAFNTGVVHGHNTEELHLDARLAPIINPLLGLVDEQIRGTVALSWTHRRVRLTALATGGESIDQSTTQAMRLGTAEIDAAYEANPWLTLDGGLRGIYQEMYNTAPLKQGVVFVAVTVRMVKARF